MKVTLSAMSFNIRYANPLDGPNRWERRRQSVLDVIRSRQPDLLGCQEVTPGQRAFLEQNLDYACVGIGRQRDGGGEQVTLHWRRDRLELEDWWTYWLSPHHETPGARGWDAALPRTCTLARFRSNGTTLLAVNTHFDHAGRLARLESVRIVLELLQRHERPNEPRILMGDFNADEREAPIRKLRETLSDAFRVAAPRATAREAGTYHAFLGPLFPRPPRIDYIFTDRAAQVMAAEVVRTPGRHWGFPSDHYPVCTRVSW